MMHATTVDPNQQYPSASRRQALKALFLPSPGMAMGCASTAPINKLGSGFVRAAIFLVLLFLVGVATAQAGQLVTFLPPANGYYAKNGNYTASLRLSGSANPRTLKITSGNLDVTAQFNAGGCSQAPCTITGTLTSSAGVHAGQNYLTATVQGKNGSVDAARQRFSYKVGLGDPTDGSAPGHIVPIQQNGSTVMVMTPTPVTVEACANPQIRITAFDRTSLLVRATACYDATPVVAAVLGQYTEGDLIVITAPWGSGTADFSSMGGNGDMINKAGYYAVGYGAGSPGTAYEAWQQPGDNQQQVKTVQGNLVNIGCLPSIPACSQNSNTAFYAFQPTDAQGFSIVPGAAGAPGNPGLPTIYVGNPEKIPSGAEQPPPNQSRPMNTSSGGDLFSYKSYTPTRGNWSGGMYLLTLNRSNLTYQSDQLYVTNSGNRTNDNAQIAALATALSNKNPNHLFLLTTAGIPFDGYSNIAPLTAAVKSLGVSQYALQSIVPDMFGNPPRAGFSMIGYSPWVVADMNKNYSTAGNVQQGETGALQGVFARKQTPYYEAVGVAPFNVDSLPIYPAPDDYLKNAVSYAIGSSEPVAWPQMETAAKKKAYAYLSQQLINYNLYGGENTGECTTECYDVRFYYTGIDAPIIYAKTKPADVAYPGDNFAANNGFALADFVAVQQQLSLESVYLSEVVAYENYVTALSTDDSTNVALALQDSATSIANALEKMLGTPAAATKESKVHMAGEILNTVAAFASFGGIGPDATLLTRTIAGLGGLLGGSGNIMLTILDAQKQGATPDPYVNQLGDLLQQASGEASIAAAKYSNDLKTANSIFFNGIYSDWFRLQSVALQSINQTYGGWYVADQPSARASYLQVLGAGQRAKTWQQLFPQYFIQAGFLGVGTGYRSAGDGTDHNTTVSNFLGKYIGPQYTRISLGDTHFYSWDSRTANNRGCEDLNFVFLKDEWNSTWPDNFGNMLFGNGTNSDGTHQLNLDRNFFYDFSQIPWFVDTKDQLYYPLVVTNQDDGNGAWDCASNSRTIPSSMLQPTFSGLSASQAINQGAKSITLQGIVSATGSGVRYYLPAGDSILITINDVTLTTSVDSTGNFGSNFDTSSIPSSGTPYTITYAYGGHTYSDKLGYGLYPATDVSTTLTVNSTNTVTDLAVDGAPAAYGLPITLSATVKSPAGTPTGSVTFLDGANSLGSVNLYNGSAQFSASALSTGTHQISATYAGAGALRPSTSAPVSVVVNPLTTAFSNLTPSQTIDYATPTISLAGTIAAVPIKRPVLQLTQASTNESSGLVLPYRVSGVSTNSATYSMWIKTSVKTQQMFFYTAYLHPFIYMQNDKLCVSWDGSTPSAGWLSTDTTPISDGQWHHVAISFDQGKMTLYKDGVATGDSFTVTAPGVDNPLNSPVNFGGSWAQIPSFVGEMWNAKIWAKASSAADVQADMYQTYGSVLPDKLNLLTAFDATANIATNLVTGDRATPSNSAIAIDALPSLYPAAGEQVSVKINESTQTFNVGANGSFSGTFPVSTLDAGPYPVQYSYKGNTILTTATDGGTTLTINKLTPVYSGLTASQTINAGTATVTLGGTLKAGTVVPPGSVSIIVNGVTTAASIQDGGVFQASIDTSSLKAGSYPVYYEFLAITNFNAAIDKTTTTLTVQAAAAATTTTVASSDFSADYGETVTFSATVTSQNGTPTGSALFYDGTTQIGSGVLNSGKASFQTSSLLPGQHSIKAAYDGGNTAFAKSTSSALNQTVNKLTPTFTVLTASQTINTGTPSITLGGKIVATGAPITGNVIITVNGVAYPATIGNDGTFSAVVDTHALEADAYTVTYDFAKSDIFSETTDTSTKVTVQKVSIATTTTLTSSLNPAGYKTQVTFTAAVTSQSGTPTGSVIFYDGSTPLGSAALNEGKALFTTSSLTLGTRSITAAYDGGNTNFIKSTSTVLNQVVNPLTTAFSNLTPSQTIDYATPTISLAGTIAAVPIKRPVLQLTQASTNESSGLVLPYRVSGVSTNSATYSMWIKTSVKTQQMFFYTAYLHPFIYMQNDKLCVSWDGSTPSAGWLSTDTTPISDGQWHHVAISFDQGKMTLYKDGVATGDSFTVTAPGVDNPLNSPVNFGGSWAQIPSFVGEMWNAKIWAKASSAADVQADMYQTYGSVLPDKLNLLTAFDATANIATNLVTGDRATPSNSAIAIDALPSLYPAAGEQVSVKINESTQTFNVGANGSFSGTFPVSTLDAGPYPVQYSYKGNTILTTATDGGTTLTINKLTPVYSGLTASQTINAGTATVTLGGKIASGSAYPTGTVSIIVNNVGTPAAIGTDGTFSATVATSALKAGSYGVTYSYPGGGNFGSANDASTTLTVQALAMTTTLLGATPNPGVYGANVTFTATVTSTKGTPTGSVNFLDGSAPLGTGALNANGTATYATSSLAPGQHSITATYAADGTYATSTSTVWVETIKANAAFSGLTSPTISAGATSVVFPGVVGGAGPTYPDGSKAVTVTVAAGPKQLVGSATPDGSGKFSVTINPSSLVAGTYTVQYSYPGDSKLNSGNGSGTTLTVQSAGPVTPQLIFTANPNPAIAGQAVTFSVKVTQVGSVVPTGNVTISETQTPAHLPLPGGVVTYGNADLVNGVATIVVDKNSAAQLSAGTHLMSATYGGDGVNGSYLGNNTDLLLTVNDAVGGADRPSLKITVASIQKSGGQLTVNLKIDNTGSAAATNTVLTGVSVKTLTGTGTATVVSALPIVVGQIAPQGSVTQTLILTVPATVQRISLTENGTLKGANAAPVAFSSSQMLIL